MGAGSGAEGGGLTQPPVNIVKKKANNAIDFILVFTFNPPHSAQSFLSLLLIANCVIVTANVGEGQEFVFY
jgi:hypothetical protein